MFWKNSVIKTWDGKKKDTIEKTGEVIFTYEPCHAKKALTEAVVQLSFSVKKSPQLSCWHEFFSCLQVFDVTQTHPNTVKIQNKCGCGQTNCHIVNWQCICCSYIPQCHTCCKWSCIYMYTLLTTHKKFISTSVVLKFSQIDLNMIHIQNIEK